MATWVLIGAVAAVLGGSLVPPRCPRCGRQAVTTRPVVYLCAGSEGARTRAATCRRCGTAFLLVGRAVRRIP